MSAFVHHLSTAAHLYQNINTHINTAIDNQLLLSKPSMLQILSAQKFR